MKKSIALALALIFTLSLVGCRENAVLKKSKVYEISSDIRSLEVRIGAAEFNIKQAEEFSVESNLKNLSVSEDNGILSIVDETKRAISYTDAMLTLCIPTGIQFEDINIATGAAKLTADDLSAQSIRLELGAGDVMIESLNAESYIEIKGGTGKITIADGMLNDLELEMGVGKLELTAALLGDCDLSFGVGSSDLTLIGSADDYSFDIKKAIGSIKIDGKAISELENKQNGVNRIDIEGGVGSIDLRFQEAKDR